LQWYSFWFKPSPPSLNSDDFIAYSHTANRSTVYGLEIVLHKALGIPRHKWAHFDAFGKRSVFAAFRYNLSNASVDVQSTEDEQSVG
jgi:hypothetical protein